MGRLYTAEVNGVSVSAIQDLWEILAPADACLIIHSFTVGQNSDTGDAAEEILNLIGTRGVGSVTSGSGGSTPTAHPVQDGAAASGATVEANNTTQMVVGSGTLENLFSANWNVRVPYEKIWTPEERPIVSPSNRFVIELSGPADAITVQSTITFEELGG